MNSTFESEISAIFSTIISNNELHAKWLNTLSYLENCGARKIAACEHPTLVKEEMLKHAAEEFRHAHHLKKQITKVTQQSVENYSLPNLVGGVSSLQYLNHLDLKTCRFLASQGISFSSIKAVSYLLVTYAIEVRAEELYTIYDRELRKYSSRVSVKSILLEEKEHLNEMVEGLKLVVNGLDFAKQICKIEEELCQKWLKSVRKSCEAIPK